MVNRAIENAQRKVEAHHFDSRKHLLEYDDVMNQQRKEHLRAASVDPRRSAAGLRRGSELGGKGIVVSAKPESEDGEEQAPDKITAQRGRQGQSRHETLAKRLEPVEVIVDLVGWEQPEGEGERRAKVNTLATITGR